MVNLFGWFSKWQITKGLGVALLGLTLISCSDTDGPPEDLFGVAAAGAAIQGSVTLVDAKGTRLSKAINVDGSFRFDVRQMTVPFMLKTVASNGLDPDLYSYVTESNVIVNITPLTTVAMYLANGYADLGILYDSWASGASANITPLAIEAAQARVNANLYTQFTAFSLDPLTYDFFGTRFSANGTSIDGLLDALTVDISAGVDIAVAGLGTLVFDDAIDISGYDIGGTNVAIADNYTVKLNVTVDGAASTERYLSINYPADLLPTISDQNVRDLFVSFYGTEGAIVINSVTPTVDDITLTVYAVVDASITTVDDAIVNYVATYTYTLNP